jgi:hypothetical protein
MTSINRDTVSAKQVVRLIGPDNLIVPLPARLSYSRQDPYALTMAFDPGLGEPVEWTFSRDLLASALHGPEGIGDVRAWPSVALASPVEGAAEAGEKILNIMLGSPTGRACFEASAAAIEAFLSRTYEMVPGGQEAACLNLDAELNELLSQA